MNILFDIILIVFSSIIFYKSYKKIIFEKNCSISNYLNIIIYVFCVIPIVLNYLVGIPNYHTIYWYKPFIEPMKNENVSIIYDVYVFFTMFLLHVLLSRKKNNIELKNENTLTSLFSNNKIIAILLIISPILLIVASGTLKNYLIFSVASNRGFSENTSNSFMTPCLLISLLTYFSILFKNNITFKKIILSFIYFFVIVWISGKRFMIANIILLFIFYVVNMNFDLKKRKRIFRIIPIFGIFLILFSVFYLTKIRPMQETSYESVYDMLRVDFGRDDVIKYVIYEDTIKGNKILNYRGQSFLSLIGSFVPRKLWKSKPYPHYMYLTSSILNLSIFKLPAGTTPSFLEMVICNCGIFGYFLCSFILLFLCCTADKIKDIDNKAISLLLFTVLLTQSMDVYLIIIVMFFLAQFFGFFFKHKSIKFVWR